MLVDAQPFETGLARRGVKGRSFPRANSRLAVKPHASRGYTRKTGGGVLSATSEKNTRTPKKILVVNGRMLCPYCKSYLGRAVYGAKAAGIEVFCKSSRCHKHLRIEL